MTLKQMHERVMNTPQKDWVQKLNDQLNRQDYNIGEPSVDVVLESYALPLLSEYNDRKYGMRGQLTMEHLDPGEVERREVSEIIAALLIERQIINDIGNDPKVYVKIQHRLTESLK